LVVTSEEIWTGIDTFDNCCEIKAKKKKLQSISTLFFVIMYKVVIFLALFGFALAQNIRQGSAGADVVVSKKKYS